jgi:hypothetical protein
MTSAWLEHFLASISYFHFFFCSVIHITFYTSWPIVITLQKIIFYLQHIDHPQHKSDQGKTVKRTAVTETNCFKVTVHGRRGLHAVNSLQFLLFRSPPFSKFVSYTREHYFRFDKTWLPMPKYFLFSFSRQLKKTIYELLEVSERQNVLTI